MKNKTLPVTGLASDHNAEPVAIKLNASALAGGAVFPDGHHAARLSTEQLLRVGTIYTELQMSLLFGVEQPVTRGVMAGIVATLHAILSPAQFRDVMIQWEIDAIKLSELLELAGQNQQEQTKDTEKNNFIDA